VANVSYRGRLPLAVVLKCTVLSEGYATTDGPYHCLMPSIGGGIVNVTITVTVKKFLNKSYKSNHIFKTSILYRNFERLRLFQLPT